MTNAALNLLGLALRGGNLAVGEEPTEAVARARDARLLILASDAADNTGRRVRHFADAGQCIWVRVPFTKAELGRTLGRSAVAVCAVTDVGLAAAIAHKLAQADPEKFSETASRLDLKAQRAKERREEQLRHEKNVRTGKYQKKEKPVPVEEASQPRREEKKDDKRQDYKGGKPRRDGKGVTHVKSRPFKDQRSKPKKDRFANSRPVKKGKGSKSKAERT